MSCLLKVGSFLGFDRPSDDKVRVPPKPCLRLPPTSHPEPAGWWEKLSSLFVPTKRREVRQGPVKQPVRAPSPSSPSSSAVAAPAKRVTFNRLVTVKTVDRWMVRGVHVWEKERYVHNRRVVRREAFLRKQPSWVVVEAMPQLEQRAPETASPLSKPVFLCSLVLLAASLSLHIFL